MRINKLLVLALLLAFNAMTLSCLAVTGTTGPILGGNADLGTYSGGYTGFNDNGTRADLNFNNHATLNWNTLNVGTGQTLNFNNGSFSVLNNVSGSMSTFAGTVSSTGTGTILISNPNGMLMTPGASFAMAGPLVLTTQGVTLNPTTGIPAFDAPTTGSTSYIEINGAALMAGGELVLRTANGADYLAVSNSTITVNPLNAPQSVIMDTNGDFFITAETQSGQTILQSKGDITVSDSTIISDLTAECLATTTLGAPYISAGPTTGSTYYEYYYTTGAGTFDASGMTEEQIQSIPGIISYEIQEKADTTETVTRISDTTRGDITITNTNVYDNGNISLTARNITLDSFASNTPVIDTVNAHAISDTETISSINNISTAITKITTTLTPVATTTGNTEYIVDGTFHDASDSTYFNNLPTGYDKKIDAWINDDHVIVVSTGNPTSNPALFGGYPNQNWQSGKIAVQDIPNIETLLQGTVIVGGGVFTTASLGPNSTPWARVPSSAQSVTNDILPLGVFNELNPGRPLPPLPTTNPSAPTLQDLKLSLGDYINDNINTLDPIAFAADDDEDFSVNYMKKGLAKEEDSIIHILAPYIAY